MPIRLELLRQFATEEEWAKLTPEQRQKIISESESADARRHAGHSHGRGRSPEARG
jgi:hypothetical protein